MFQSLVRDVAKSEGGNQLPSSYMRMFQFLTGDLWRRVQVRRPMESRHRRSNPSLGMPPCLSYRCSSDRNSRPGSNPSGGMTRIHATLGACRRGSDYRSNPPGGMTRIQARSIDPLLPGQRAPIPQARCPSAGGMCFSLIPPRRQRARLSHTHRRLLPYAGIERKGRKQMQGLTGM